MSTDNTPAHPPTGHAPEPELAATNPDKVYRIINDHADGLELPDDVIDTTIDLFRETYQTQSLAARGTEIAVAAAIRVACQNLSVPRALDEIAAVTGSDAKLIAREARKIQRSTGLHTTPVGPGVYVDRWGDKLGIDRDTRREAIKLLGDTNPGRAPPAAAAGALWTVLAPRDDRDVTQDDIVEATHTSAYTLREVREDIQRR